MSKDTAWRARLVAAVAGGFCGLAAVCLAKETNRDRTNDNTQVAFETVRTAQERRPVIEQAVNDVVERTNQFRRRQGLGELAVSPLLRQAAQEFVAFMAQHDRFGHEADGRHPRDRAIRQGYQYCIVLENISYRYRAKGYSTEELGRRVFEGWKRSPGHRKNMLDPDVLETGVAISQSAVSGRYYAVQMFGRPHGQRFEFAVVNHTRREVRYTIGARTFHLAPRVTRIHRQCRPAEFTLHRTVPRTRQTADPTASLQPHHQQRILIESDRRGHLALRTE